MLYFIVNPVAGRGRTTAEIRGMLEPHLRARDLPSVWEVCAHPGHATLLAQEAQSRGATAVYCVGGDGSAHEVAHGLVGSTIPMGILPCGTGNDLAKLLGLPADPLEAFQCQRRDAYRLCDAWHINDHFLLNVAGTGFDSEALLNAARFKRLGGGKLSYLVGVLTTILTHRDVELELQLNGTTRQVSLLMLSVANGRFIGGGIYAAPEAQLDDGLLDVILYHPLPKWKMPFKLSKFFSGKQLQESFVEMHRADALHFRSDRDMMVQIDGELHAWRSVEIRRASAPLWLMAHRDDPKAFPAP